MLLGLCGVISLPVWCLPRLLLVPLRGHCVTMPPNSCGVGVPDSSLLPRWGLGMHWEQMTEQRHSCAGKGRVYFHAACPDLCPRPGGMESCSSAGGPGRLQPPSQRHPGGMCLPRGHVTGPVSPLPRYLMALASFRWGCSRSTFPRGQGGSVAATGVPRPLCFRGGWRWMQLPALPSLSLIRWLIPMSPRGSGRGSSGSSGAGSGFSVLHPGCPRRGQARVPHPRGIHRVPRRGRKGWMWRRSAGEWPQPQLLSGGGQRVDGDPNTIPGTVPTAPPAPCSWLRGGLGGVSHSPGAVEGQAESGGCQQQGQGGQQPPPRLSPTSCCQLHLWGHTGEQRGALGYPKPRGDRGLGPCPECLHHHTGWWKGDGGSFVPLWASQGGF